MNYQKIYINLIERAKSRIPDNQIYYECHHIIPRCIGGTNNLNNLCYLTPEEHYIAHQLLTKIYSNNPKLIRAAVMMISNRPNNKLYGWLRRRFSEIQSISQSGNGNSQYGTTWITNGLIEKKILKDEPLPDGWFNQRLVSYKNSIEKQKIKKYKKIEDIKKLKLKILELRELHSVYINKGFETVKALGYKYTQQNLVKTFAKYLPEFIPQNGKCRYNPS